MTTVLHDDLGQILTAIKINLRAAGSTRWRRARKLAESTVLIEEGVTSTGYMALVLHGEAMVANSVSGSSEPVQLGKLGCGALDRSKPVVTVCESGPRAAIAASLLQREGFDVSAVAHGGIADFSDTVAFRRCGA